MDEMSKKNVMILSGMLMVLLVAGGFWVNGARGQAKEPTKLAVVWTSGDPDVAYKVCFMYTHNAKKNKWFDEVKLIIWGPSSRLLAGDKDLQAAVKQMMDDGVIVEACKACADSHGSTEKLESLGITVKYMGKPLTNMLQGDWEVMVF